MWSWLTKAVVSSSVPIQGKDATFHLKWESKEKSAMELACVYFDESGKVLDFSTGADSADDGSHAAFANSNKTNELDAKFELARVSPKVQAIALVGVSMFHGSLKEVSSISVSAGIDGTAHTKDLTPGKSSVMLLGFFYRSKASWLYKLEGISLIEKQARTFQDALPELTTQLGTSGVVDKEKLAGIYHVIFVMDSSGSMQGQRWTDLCAAVKNFISTRLKSTKKDIFTIVSYNDSSTIHVEGAHMYTDLKSSWFHHSSGGTSFAAALTSVMQVLNRNKHHDFTPLVLFLSDGESSDGDTEMQDIANAHLQNGLRVFTIGFGSDSDHAKLKNMAALAKGTFCHSQTGIDLNRTFQEIASNVASVNP